MRLDATHDARARSWVPGADGHPDFPIQNLPLGAAAPPGEAPRGVVAIGEHVLDLARVSAAGVLQGEAAAACALACGETLNLLLEAGEEPRRALRAALFAALQEGAEPHPEWLLPPARCEFALPAAIGDYTDFYAGIHHATNVGRLFRPDSPLLPNYKFVPIGYHGRASSVRVSGAEVRRPWGQVREGEGAVLAPSARLDFELELGIWIGPGSPLGTPIPIGEAARHIAGFCLLNDWSARDVQAWEYQPLGPFLAKNFITSVSPWIVTPEALAPFRAPLPPRPSGDPAPLPYLDDENDAASGALDLKLQVFLRTAAMRTAAAPAACIARGSSLDLYWTPAQLVAHHTVGGCDLRAGDLFGTGTISSAGPEGRGSLLEITEGGRVALTLPGGETRRFLEDGDEVMLTAHAEREGFARIGFGACSGVVANPLAA